MLGSLKLLPFSLHTGGETKNDIENELKNYYSNRYSILVGLEYILPIYNKTINHKTMKKTDLLIYNLCLLVSCRTNDDSDDPNLLEGGTITATVNGQNLFANADNTINISGQLCAIMHVCRKPFF